MTSPGKHLLDLAKYLEKQFGEYGVDLDCVDLSFNSAIVPPMLKADSDIFVDVGFDQNPFRFIDVKTKQPIYRRLFNQSQAQRFNGLVRISGAYDLDPNDCCHEHTEFMYNFTNIVWMASSFTQQWLKSQDNGETTQTQYVMAYNGGAVTVGISFSMIVCDPTKELLDVEQPKVKGYLNGLKNKINKKN